MQNLLKEYLSFTKKERLAIIGLLALVLIAYILPYFIAPPHKTPSALELQEFKMLEQQLTKSRRDYKNYDNEKSNNQHDDAYPIAHAPPLSSDNNTRPVQLFNFDPNTISEDGWKQLGLRDKTIGTILKYLSKGGHFYDAGDLKKIYGLREEEYERLRTYVRINKPEKENTTEWRANAQANANANPYSFNKAHQPYKNASAKTIIDINTADTTAWISLPGIGSKLAARIVNFRERLGGFYDVEQILETYGLADSTFQIIQPLLTKNKHPLKQININTASLEALKQHPYIKWNIATALIRFREQHGPFTSLESLQQIAVITPDIYKKLLPYLSIADSP